MDGTLSLDRRAAHRASVMLTASISYGDEATAIIIRNLSDSGACIEAGQLPLGSPFVLRRKEQSLRGHVVWAKEDRLGVEFTRPLIVEKALRHIAAPRPHKAPVSRRPGLKCKALTPAETSIMQRWAVLAPNALGD
jgi:hypothetical protein